MMSSSSMSPNATKAEVKSLMEDRAKLETFLKEQLSILEINGVGMDEPLVDSEGYPRSDIDVYKVRHARHKIICLRNDLKDIMSRIEKGIHSIHSQGRETLGGYGAAQYNVNMDKDRLPEPFAKVNLVDEGSPASEAGLRVNDEIVGFGTLTAKNFAAMRSLADITYSSRGQTIKVVVLRGSGDDRKVRHLELTPRSWSGKGLLGCNIVPMEMEVDR